MTIVHIREATAGDTRICHGIETACFEASEAASLENIQKRQARFPQGFLVAERDQKVIGMINSGATNEPDLADEAFKAMIGHDPDGSNIVIFSVAVVPLWQGTGVSRDLLTDFIARARVLGMQRVLLLCKNDLIGYYRKFGFEDAGLSASTHGGFAWHEMYRVLA